ncbi:EF-TU receptor, partial [Prunus dulcis]
RSIIPQVLNAHTKGPPGRIIIPPGKHFKLVLLKKIYLFIIPVAHMTGRIPREIGNLTMLKIVYLDFNNFEEIPNLSGSRGEVKELSMQRNGLKGPVPTYVFNMSSLTSLVLHGNSLNGSVPDNICLHLPSVEELHLAYNQFDGPLSSKFWQCKQLLILTLAINKFSGSIPRNIGNLSQLTELEISSNNLTGTTPNKIGNNLNGQIPSEIFNISTIAVISLTENQLSGSLPDISLGVPELQVLFVGLNPLNATLPVPFGNASSSLKKKKSGIKYGIQSIEWLNSNFCGRLGNLQGLDLNDNKLQGYIPYQLCQLDNLAQLMLNGNQFSGSIPSCLGNIAALRIPSLGFNLLTSTIPSSLWRLTLNLNLSSNLLNGSLSEDIHKLKVVTALDLSNNQLLGGVFVGAYIFVSNQALSTPGVVEDRRLNNLEANILPRDYLHKQYALKDLIDLALANNNLQGQISTSFGNLVSLQLLDLSQNNLSGMIPKSLEQLSHLKSLNLSFNRLQGEIPTGGPFQNFSAQSFVSNTALCVQPDSMDHISNGRRMDFDPTNTALQPQLLWRRFSHPQLLRSTNGFHESNLLGTGGFVYKGAISDGIYVAVKVFNLQIEGAFKSFDSECDVLSNIRH